MDMTLRELYQKYLEEDVEYLELIYRVFLFFKHILLRREELYLSDHTLYFLDRLKKAYVNGLSSIQVKRMVKIFLNETEMPHRLRE